MSIQDIKNRPIEILIAEDSPTQAMKLQKTLKENGFYNVSLAKNGQEALSFLKKQRFNLVISDIMMPEMDGYELCRKIKTDDSLKDIPVLLLTTLSEPEDIIKGLECGAESFITKPYNAELLLSRVQYILINQEIRGMGIHQMNVEIYFSGKKHLINPNRIQMIDLLLSTYENIIHKQRELAQANKKLQEATETIKVLNGLLPICAKCKKIRDKDGKWHNIESYISRNSEAEFTHGLCPDCIEELYPELSKMK